MIPKCCRFIDKTLKIFIFISVVTCNLFRYASADGSVSECKSILIASTVGTFAACMLVSLGLIAYLRRRLRNAAISRGSQRKMLKENGSFKEDLHFQNRIVIAQASDETDIDARRSTRANSQVPSTKKSSTGHTETTRSNLVATSTQTSECDFAKEKKQVVIEKRQDGSLGLRLSVAGLYVQTVCGNLAVKSGCCIEPGDEVLSINGQEVEGMSDMEALALLAKSGPSVSLEVIKNACLWRVQHHGEYTLQRKRTRRACTSPVCIAKEAALKRAKIEMDEALKELRRSASTSHRDSQQYLAKHRENSSPHQSLTSSVEVQDSIVEEEFVVIESNLALGDSSNAQQPKDVKIDRVGLSLDENDNSVPRTLRQKYYNSSSANTSQDSRSEEMKDKGSASDFGAPLPTHSQTKCGASISRKTSATMQEMESTRQGLSLSLPSVNVFPKKSSPPDGRGRCATFTSFKSASVSTTNSEDSSGVPQNGAFYIPYDVHVPQYTAPAYDLDKISPPPSYKVASQIFNSQKPGAKPGSNESLLEREADTIEQVFNSLTALNGYASQGSSFDEVESIFPSMTDRESVDIDEHIMRYMTKKYSEPRFPTVSSGVVPSRGSGPRFVPPASSTYLGASTSAAERPYTVQSPLQDVSSGSDVTVESISNGRALNGFASFPSESVGNQSESQILGASFNGTVKYSPKGDENCVPSTESLKVDMLPVTNIQSRRKSPDQSNGHRGDLNNSLSVANGLESNNTSARIMPGVQPRKMLSASRLARFHRQRGANENSLESMRRATSSPSVNSDHKRSASAESQGEAATEGKRTKSNSGNRRRSNGSFDRRKSIDSGSLRKLAADLQANQNLSDDFPMLSKLLGGAGLQGLESPQNVHRYRSSDTLYSKF